MTGQAPDSPDLVLADLDKLRSQADASFAAVAKAHPKEMACHQGCDDCCHALFDLSPVEAWALGRAFAGLPRKQRREALRRAAKAAGDFQGLVDQAAALPPEERDSALSRARVACALLQEGRCLLYAQRPLTCRLYGVPTAVNGRAHICFRTGFQPGQTYPTVDLGRVQAELDRLSGRLLRLTPSLPARRIDLGRALELATAWTSPEGPGPSQGDG
jgi:Fe-S-cluster containining protein